MVSKNRRGRWTEAENEKQAALKAMCYEGEFDEVASELRLKEAPTKLRDCYSVVMTAMWNERKEREKVDTNNTWRLCFQKCGRKIKKDTKYFLKFLKFL